MPRANWLSLEILDEVAVGESFTSDQFYERHSRQMVAAAVQRLRNRGHIVAVDRYNYHAKVWKRMR